MREFIERMATDSRLRQGHLCLYAAITYMGYGYSDWFPVNRKKLMAYAGIRSIATYHKYLSELVSLNIILYRPSYDPFRGSQIEIL